MFKAGGEQHQNQRQADDVLSMCYKLRLSSLHGRSRLANFDCSIAKKKHECSPQNKISRTSY